MTELEDILAELGLSMYLHDFLEQGFDTWYTILDIVSIICSFISAHFLPLKITTRNTAQQTQSLHLTSLKPYFTIPIFPLSLQTPPETAFFTHAKCVDMYPMH
jgi:hypothetical protein